MYSQTKDLFQLQTELVDMKVDMAVGKAIDRIVDQISGLKNEMHDLRNDMNNQFLALDKRFLALDKRVFALEHRFGIVEDRLGITNETKRQIKNKFIDYGFRTGWIALGALGSAMVYLTYLVAQLHALVK